MIHIGPYSYYGMQIGNRKLSNGIIFNDLEWPLTQISRFIQRQLENDKDRADYNGRPDRKLYMIYLSNGATFSDLQWSVTQNSRPHHYLMLNIWATARDRERHSYNWIQIGTCMYICPTQECHFEWPWVTLSDLAKYSMARSIARPLCDIWASC